MLIFMVGMLVVVIFVLLVVEDVWCYDFGYFCNQCFVVSVVDFVIWLVCDLVEIRWMFVEDKIIGVYWVGLLVFFGWFDLLFDVVLCVMFGVDVYFSGW